MEKRLTVMSYGKVKKILVFSLILLSFCTAVLWGENAPSVSASDAALVQGFESFRSGDWSSSTFFLKKALVNQSNSSAETWYMLIMSQINSENYSGAVADCDEFTSRFPESNLCPYVQYQKGKAQYGLGQIDSAVMTLSDFCHQNPDSELYPSALYIIADCFFDDYSFDTARRLYETIITDYASDEKAIEAKYKLSVIDQREREQKLLYLLKMTGEEYLSAKENYEKQLRQYQTEDLLDLRRQLALANARILELEKAASESLAQNGDGSYAQETTVDQNQQELEELKLKAQQVQLLMEYIDNHQQ